MFSAPCSPLIPQLVDEAALTALRRHVSAQEKKEKEALYVSLEDFLKAETRVRPSALREVAVEVPRVSVMRL